MSPLRIEVADCDHGWMSPLASHTCIGPGQPAAPPRTPGRSLFGRGRRPAPDSRAVDATTGGDAHATRVAAGHSTNQRQSRRQPVRYVMVTVLGMWLVCISLAGAALALMALMDRVHR